MEKPADLQKSVVVVPVGALRAHASWMGIPTDVPQLPSSCVICSRPSDRYVAIGAVIARVTVESYKAIDTHGCIAGFCLADRDEAASALVEHLKSDRDVHKIMGPAIDLRADEVGPFVGFMQRDLAGS